MMERVELADPGGDHPTQLGYYGGAYDGRYTRVNVVAEDEMPAINSTAREMTDYTVTRYGVHPDQTVCWIILTHTPISDRGKL